MRPYVIFILVMLTAVYTLATENEPTVADSVFLDEIVFYGDIRKFQPGAKIEELAPLQVEVSQEGGLEQILSRFMPVYTKGNAGGLTTIHFRGTAPSHTTINFGGININSLTLGQSNLSNISTYLFDRIELQFGSSSALNGSGAIGGAIYLGQNNYWTNGAKIKLKYTIGSFGERLYGAKIFLGKGKLEAITRVSFYQKENNFPFKNPYHPNRITQPEPIDDVQNGAAINNKGIVQEINYQFSPNSYIKSMFWYEDSWYQVQPNMQSNLNYTSNEEISNKNLRAWAQYKNERNKLKYCIGAGYVHDDQLYNNIEEQVVITDRLVFDASVKQKLFKISEYKFGAKYKYIVPNVYSYSEENIKNEQHLDIYFSYYIEPVKNLKATANLRQVYVTGFKAPFTPSVVAEYTALNHENSLLTINGAISRSYRIPTLNDRYWGDQGNPDLLPEDGLNLEWGIKFVHTKGENNLHLSVNLFYMDIDNWIEWRNYGVWKAFNIQRVISKGIEFQGKTQFKTGIFSNEVILNYAYNPVYQIENKVSGNVADQPNIYCPTHTGNVSYWLKYKKYSAFIDGTYTGERYTDYSGSTLPSYFLVNAGLVSPFNINKHEFTFSLQVLNLFDIQYQNEKYYAMPGRSFRLSISATLDFIKP